nr:immunoglobulin light chain junction region [Macaca mulatta]MOY04246.1 immunoglobulin light chain junction region [Macaca mulatta]
CMQALEFPWTY